MPTFEELRKQLLGGDVDQPKVQTAEPREKAKEAQTFENLRKQMLGTNGTANKVTSTGVLQTLEPAPTRETVPTQQSAVLREKNAIQKDLDRVNQELETFGNSGTLYSAFDYHMNNPEDVPMLDITGGSHAVSQRDAIQSDIDQLKELQTEKQRLEDELYLTEYISYMSLLYADDFAEKSQYKTSANGKEALPLINAATYDPYGQNGAGIVQGVQYAETGFDDIVYDYINGNSDARSILSTEEISNGQRLMGVDSRYLREMTPEEIAVYNYLYDPTDKTASDNYLKFIAGELNRRQRKTAEEYWQKWAKEDPVGSSAATILTAPMKGFGYVGQVVDYLEDGKIDENAGYNQYSHMSAAVRTEVSQTIEKSGKWGPVGSFAYQTGMGLGDFLMTTAVSGGNQALSLAIMGTGAAADATIQAKDRGLSDDQAFALGTIAGAAEIVTEKIGMDALFDTALRGKSPLVYVLKNVLGEAVEEPTSSLINNLADIYISADKSLWQKSMDAYTSKGLSEGEAFWRVTLDEAKALGMDALGGALSGFVLGGGSVGINAAANAIGNAAQSAQNNANPQGENGQVVQQTAAEPTPGSLEWVQELSDLGKGTDTAQQAAGGAKSALEHVEEILALGMNAPADPVGAAVEGFRQTGTVTNKQATDILSNSKAVQALREQVGLDLPDTAAGRRNAIKAAVEQLAQLQTESNTQTTTVNEQSGVKEQLRNNQSMLNTMEPAAEISVPTEFSKMDKAGKQNWVVEKLRSTGYKVDRKGFGIIDFAKKRLKAAFKYFDSGSAEEAAFEALPYVLENGIEISSHSDHKGRDYRTVTIAAPVLINGKRGNMAVVVKQTDGNHYKVHRILTPDGAVFDLSETTNEADRADGGVTETGSLATSNGTASLETGVIGDTAAGHRQTQPLVPVPNTSISENEQGVNNDSNEPGVARILTESPKTQRAKRSLWSWIKEGVLDKGMVFEDLALKTKNRELQAKWNSTRYAQSRAQWLIGNGAENAKSLNAIREEVEKTGKTRQFSEYLYHKHNIDRMQLQSRYDGAKNKPVFGEPVTAEESQRYVEQYEKENPSFVQLAEDVYAYMNHLRQLMVDNGVVSQNTADLWAEMYPHYVPIQRKESSGRSVNVPLDTGRTGVNAPVKAATGGNSDILPLFDTMAQRTLQTYTAIARNSFGVELKNTLGSVVSKGAQSVDEAISSVDAQEALLQEGKNGTNPTFTVFENGERVTFEVTKEMYDALKPKSEIMSYTNKVTNAVSNFHRGVLTEYNPTFMLTNAIKDVQDVLINSQHPAKTYAKIPQAYVELAKKGEWYKEYVANGGEQNTYFDSENSSFETKDKGLKKLLNVPPISTISKLNTFIEMAPRLAEYIASREAGSSIDVAMLDAARVTTNFAAGGDLTKLLDRNGATFLNASMQGVVQQARNIREAKANGWKGAVGLAVRFALAGLPEALLNGLIWDDDEDYAKLSDYVKDNYYILWKYDDGQFVKIPKGRVTAVIQGAVRRIIDTATGNDDADWGRLLELVGSSLAPNNPFESNIASPIQQVLNNKTWYGEDLVPTRLQDLPAAEQYDESTDALSKWLGEKLNVSPVKINYLLNQYGGGIADTVLPMLTPEAESGDNSLVGNLLAPLKDKFTTDSVMNNQNVTDFYDKLDELTTNAKAGGATVEDQILYKYINSVNSKLRDLYAEKRKVQSGNLPDDQKYAKVRSIQQKITDAAQKALVAIQSPYSADKSGMVAGVIGDSITDLTDCWKNGADTAAAVAAIDKAYDAYTKMDDAGKKGVEAEGGRTADYLIARENGISTKTFVDLYKTYYSIDNGNGNASIKASKWSYELEKAQEKGTITTAQKNALKENMNFWQMIPAETERFDELTDSGLSADKADFIMQLLNDLMPESGSSSVRPIQRIAAIANADSKLDEAEQKTAMKSVLDDKGYAKYLEVLKLGMSTDDYATSYRMFLDAEGKDKKKRTIAQYQQGFGVSYDVAKKLYEIYNPPRS